MAEERGLKCDTAGFWKEMEKLQKLSQEASKGGSEFTIISINQKDDLSKKKVPTTSTESKYQSQENFKANLISIWDGQVFLNSIDETSEDTKIALILDKSPFYYESGGQVSDIGFITSPDEEFEFQVEDCQESFGYVMHIGTVIKGTFKVNDPIVAQVNYDYRRDVIPNHSMTHILNQALREKVGSGVDQHGSHVNKKRLRFDFNSEKLSSEHLQAVESFCNEQINKNLKMYTKDVKKEKAFSVNGLRAMFTGKTKEDGMAKYPPIVRVVSVGVPVEDVLKNPDSDEWKNIQLNYAVEHT
eukprot:UN24203